MLTSTKDCFFLRLMVDVNIGELLSSISSISLICIRNEEEIEEIASHEG